MRESLRNSKGPPTALTIISSAQERVALASVGLLSDPPFPEVLFTVFCESQASSFASQERMSWIFIRSSQLVNDGYGAVGNVVQAMFLRVVQSLCLTRAVSHLADGREVGSGRCVHGDCCVAVFATKAYGLSIVRFFAIAWVPGCAVVGTAQDM